jgi:hypothetical protein
MRGECHEFIEPRRPNGHAVDAHNSFDDVIESDELFAVECQERPVR